MSCTAVSSTFVSPGFDALNGGLGDDVGDNADALRWAVIGIKDSDAADHGVSWPGRGMGETLPSAPAVVLPTTTAFGIARKAMAVYSAWLCDVSSTRMTSLPP
jgi:hypothetical protein